MGLFKKLKKLRKKSVGGKLLNKALSKDPVGRKIAKRDPLARSLGVGGEDDGGRRRGGPLAQLAGRITKTRQTGGGAQRTPTGPNMRHMITGGPGQRSRNTGIVPPRQTGGGGQRSPAPVARNGGTSPLLRMSGLAGRSRGGRGIRR